MCGLKHKDNKKRGTRLEGHPGTSLFYVSGLEFLRHAPKYCLCKV